MDEAAAGFHAAWRLMVELCPGHSWERSGHVVTAVTGLPVPPFNGIWTTAPDAPTAEVLAAVDALPADDLPWNVQLRGAATGGLEDGLRSRGLVPTAEIPLMVATPDDLRAPEVDQTFTRVVTYEDVGHHLRLLELAFGMPEDLTRRSFPMALLTAPGVAPCLGWTDGEVTTTGLRVLVEGSVGVFNIATPVQHRRKGLGAGVTAHLVRDGFAHGARLAWLQASPLGEPVYRRLGFRTAETWQQWMPAALVG